MRIHPRRDVGHRGVEPAQNRRRIQAHPHRQHQQRRERHELTQVEVEQPFVLRVLDPSEHRPLIERQHVGRAQDDAAGREHGPHFAGDEHALQNQEFADESVQRRQADRRHRHDEEDRREDGHHLRQAAVLGDLARVTALVHDPDDEEECTRRDAVIELLHDAAGNAHRIQREHAEHDQRHVADRRVGHQPLPVALRQRDERAVHDPDDREHDDHRHEMFRRVGQNRQAETKEPVGPHLQEDSGQNHGAGRRRVGVRVGQPGVEREHRDLDREAEEEREEDPPLQVERQIQLVELGDVERVRTGHAVAVEVHRQDAQQHHDAADQRVEEKLDGGIQPVRAAPDADEEIHRHQHDLPEEEEEQEVERHERAEHPGLQDEQEDVVLLHALGNGVPRRQHGDRPHHGRQENQQRAEAVGAEEIFGADGRDPGRALDELKLGVLRVVLEPQGNRDNEPRERDDVRNPPDGIHVLLVDQQQQQGAGQRQEQDDR